jgi:tetratricopeptide (TPR) repeat protein
LEDRQRSLMLKIYLIGMAGVAVITGIIYAAALPVPFWSAERFGPFPNRNQTANVFALAGVLAFALGLRQLRHEKRSGWVWLGVMGVFLAVILANGSRAGLVLYMLGCGAWLLWEVWDAREKSRAAIGASVALLALALALLAGGETLDRTLATLNRSGEWTADARWKIQRDALDMVADQPVFGVGLANFDGVFAFHRAHFQDQSRPIHPESDWVWLAGEGGVPAALMLAALAGWWLWVSWPRAGQTERRLRMAAWVAAVVFMLHSQMDVPGHRLGSVLPLLMLVPVAWPPRPRGPMISGVLPRATLVLMGLGTAVLGGIFVAQAAGRIELPGRFKKENLLAQVDGYSNARLYYDVINTCEVGMKLAPLEWRFYRESAQARMRINVGWDKAAMEFRRARLLEPDSPFVTFQEGAWWVGRRPELALDAWRASLKRKMDGRTSLFRQMLEAAARDPELLAQMDVLVADYPELDFFFLGSVTDEVFDRRLSALLAQSPESTGLKPADSGEFFRVWRERRGDVRFLAELAAHPAWERLGWWTAAQAHAQQGHWAEALNLADRYLTPPSIPTAPVDQARALELLRRYPDDVAAGYSVVALHRAAGKWKEAEALLARLSRASEAPAYLHYLHMEALRKLGNDEEAWKGLVRYIQRAGSG